MSLSDSAIGPDPEQVRELARSFWHSAILRAGIKLDVFSTLETGRLTSKEVANRIGASPRYTQSFLESCVVLGLLDRDGDHYINSALSSQYLVKSKPEYIGDHAVHHTNAWATWGRLDEVIREGKTLLPYETGYVDADTYWNNYMIGQHNRAASGQSDQLVKALDIADKRKLLDLGGGAASYSIALCAANPELRSVVVDRKEPLSVARPLVEQSNLGERITLLEGDFFNTSLEADYDVALISGVVLILPEEACRRLFQLAYNSLLPGGLMVVQDFMRIDHSPGRNRLDTLYDLYVLAAFDPGASDREGAEVASWLEEAGFENPKLIPLPTQLVLVTAEKPLAG